MPVDNVEMMPESEWSTNLEAAPDVLVAPEMGNVVVAIVNGNQICVLSAADGTVRGVVETKENATYAGAIKGPNGTGIALVQDSGGTVHGVDLSDGTEVWQATAETVLMVGDDTVYLASGPRLWACEPETGDERWSVTAPADIRAIHERDAGILVEFDDNSTEKGILSVDPSSGEQQWIHNRSERVSYQMASDGVYILVFGEDDAALGRLDERTGGERWLYPCDVPSVFQTAIGENAVYACIGATIDDRAIVGVDATGGSELWRCADLSLIDIPDIYAHDDAVFVDTMDALTAIDPKSGNVAWTVPLERSVKEIHFRPDAVYVWAGDVIRIQRETGRVEWRVEGEPFTDGTLSADFVYASRRKDWVQDIGTGAIDALERDTGKTRWSFAGPTDAEIIQITDDYALLAAVGGSFGSDKTQDLYLLNPEDGSDRWFVDADDGYVVSGDALFVADGATVQALGLISDPAAFDSPDSGTVTLEQTASSSKTGTSGEETSDKANGEAKGETTPNSNGDRTAPAYCPNCGGSLSEYEAPVFCVHCGGQL